MKNWTHALSNAMALKTVYGSTIPALAGVDLHEVVLHRDGPRISLRFDLRDFPEPGPPQWVSQGFNRVQLTLAALGIRALRIDGLSTKVQVDIDIGGLDAGWRIRMSGTDFQLDLVSDHLILQRISAYRHGS